MRPEWRRWYAAGGLAVCALAATVRPAGRNADHVTLSILADAPAKSLTRALLHRTAYETDVQRIARVFHQLGLPLPEQITLRLYSSAELLTRGLGEDVGLAPSLATTIGEVAVGVALDETLLVLEPEFRRGPRAWLRLVAHEMAHLSQIQLAGGEDCGARWLAEGMADWVAFTVLDRLGVAPMGVERDSILMSARDSMATTGLELDLDQIDEPLRFLEHARNVGVQPLYRLAFLRVHHLIQQRGFDTLVGYFRACPSRTAERARFERVFGQRVVDFERDVVQALRSRTPEQILLRDPRSSTNPPA